jgi:rpsU-divergently transcribed protein
MNSQQLSILKAAVPFIPVHGFTHNSLISACSSLGLSPSAAGILESGPLDLAVYFYQSCNDDLSRLLRENSEFQKLGVTSKIRSAIIQRLHLINPVLDKYHQVRLKL